MRSFKMEGSCRQWVHVRLLCGLVVFVAGCTPGPNSSAVNSEPQPAIVEASSIVDGSSPTPSQQEKIIAAKEILFSRLSVRLMEALVSEGASGAIDVCSKEAKSIGELVGQSERVAIGRIGVRLRNPLNQPPSWAKSLVDSRIDTPTFVLLSNQHAAGLLPIKLQPQCLMCHGPEASLAPGVSEQLARLYPDDQAIGFKEGELRGWFWVELLD